MPSASSSRRTTKLDGAAATTLLIIGLCGIAASLLTLRHLPFQDVPNHIQVLALDQALRAGRVITGVERGEAMILGYSLYIDLGRLLLACGLTAAQAITTICVLVALLVPLAVARLAYAANLDPRWAAISALPLALCWSMRMGFVSYVLALPFALAFVAAIMTTCRRPSKWSTLEAGVWALLCYVAHPLAFAAALALGGVVWLALTGGNLRALGRLIVAAAPALALMLRDLALHGFSQLPSTRMTWRPVSVIFRRWDEAAAHLVTRSFGVTDAWSLAFFAPLLALLFALLAATVWRVRRTAGDGTGSLLLAGAVAAVMSVALPTAVGVAFFIGDRLAIFAAAAVLTALGGGLDLRHPAWRAAMVLAVVAAMVGTVREIRVRADRTTAIVDGDGEGGQHALSGRFLTVRLSDCPYRGPDSHWGLYDSERHVWIYSMSVDGLTPYLFAFARYLPVWYREDQFADQLFAPPEWTANAQRTSRDSISCQNDEILRILRIRALSASSHFDGLVVTGMPAQVTAALSHLQLPSTSLRRVLPGVVLIASTSEPPR